MFPVTVTAVWPAAERARCPGCGDGAARAQQDDGGGAGGEGAVPAVRAVVERRLLLPQEVPGEQRVHHGPGGTRPPPVQGRTGGEQKEYATSPPGRCTRSISATAARGSSTVSITQADMTTSKVASANGSACTDATARVAQVARTDQHRRGQVDQHRVHVGQGSGQAARQRPGAGPATRSHSRRQTRSSCRATRPSTDHTCADRPGPASICPASICPARVGSRRRRAAGRSALRPGLPAGRAAVVARVVVAAEPGRHLGAGRDVGTEAGADGHGADR